MSSPPLQLRACSLRATHALAACIARVARPGDMILLAGEMGTGKTAFAQGFGQAMGVVEPITSPTFTLVHSYDTDGPTLHHADLYRLDHVAEVADLALSELAEHDGIVLVEWGDVVESTFGDHLLVRLAHVDDDPGARAVTVQAFGRSWATRWDRLAAECERAVAAAAASEVDEAAGASDDAAPGDDGAE
jgi:tRNA threonylcarbamoyladenosine biosynthesis protein TsaE